MSLVDVRYDPFDPDIIDDPFPAYQVMRDRHPVYWAEASNTWVLSRHEDVQAALLDPGTFSSVGGIFPTPAGSPSLMESFLPMLITLDPPRHDRLRALVSRAFTVRRIASMEDGIAQVTNELLDALGDRTGHGDFVAEFSGALPVTVIADLLGVPTEDKASFRVWTNHIAQLDPVHGATDEGLAALGELYAYLSQFLGDRRRAPREDLMSSLVLAEIDGVRLSDEEVLGFCALLLLAGNETTTNLLSNTVVVLSRNPDARRRLVEDAGLIAPAIEEMLRFESPIQGLVRRLTHDVTLHDTPMSTGDGVLLLFGSANRDERVFIDPDRFDLDRRPDRHLGLGKGIHFCLGAALARMEARIGITELMKRGYDWELDLSGAQRLRSGPVRGYRSLPIRWNVR